jgi:hypothetical protein
MNLNGFLSITSNENIGYSLLYSEFHDLQLMCLFGSAFWTMFGSISKVYMPWKNIKLMFF